MKLHPDVEVLLHIQELLHYRRQVAEGDARPLVREANDDAIGHRILEHAARLTPRTRSGFERMAERLDEIIVPVIDGVCNACRVRVPTGAISMLEVGACPSCGRFLYEPAA